MACMVCQHCHGQLCKENGISVEGYSYHKKCHKCYVCSETNLKNAEVFKGVIFCFSCSQRIFQGCSSARKSKNGNRAKAAVLAKIRRRQRSRHQENRRSEHAKHRRINGVIEMTRLAASSASGSSNTTKTIKKTSNSLTLLSKPSKEERRVYADASKDLKKKSAEIGMTTEVTQELLRQINCPVVNDIKLQCKNPVLSKLPKEKGDSRYNKTFICSDLRIAELGASTEIAHMALRKKSELPVIIKSDSHVKDRRSLSVSGSNQESDASRSDNDYWLDSAYSLREFNKTSWLHKTIGSLLKIPYLFFKNKILKRSSLISVAIKANRNSAPKRRRLKLFHEEISEHQSRGMKRLYSTINRRGTPYKLGWLNLVSKVSTVIKPECTTRQLIEEPKRCKHFRRSHSYRCMRAHVMKLAGPTKSELAVLREKLKNLLFPPLLLANAIEYDKGVPSFVSQACGADFHPLIVQSQSVKK